MGEDRQPCTVGGGRGLGCGRGCIALHACLRLHCHDGVKRSTCFLSACETQTTFRLHTRGARGRMKIRGTCRFGVGHGGPSASRTHGCNCKLIDPVSGDRFARPSGSGMIPFEGEMKWPSTRFCAQILPRAKLKNVTTAVNLKRLHFWPALPVRAFREY